MTEYTFVPTYTGIRYENFNYPILSIQHYFQEEIDFCLIRSSNERKHIFPILQLDY